MGKHQGQNNAREWAQPKEIPPYLDQGTKVLRLIQLCPAPQPWHWPQGRALPFPPKFLLQSSHLQIQRAASPWPYRTPGWVLCCQLWVWRTLHWLYCPCSHPGEGPVLPSRAAWGEHSSWGATRPMDGKPVRTAMAGGQSQGCSLGDQPCASVCGHQQDSAAHTGLERRTQDVIQMTALWTPRYEVESPSSTLSKISLLSWHSLHGCLSQNTHLGTQQSSEYLWRVHFLLTHRSSSQSVGSSRQLSMEQALASWMRFPPAAVADLIFGLPSSSMFVGSMLRKFVFCL